MNQTMKENPAIHIISIASRATNKFLHCYNKRLKQAGAELCQAQAQVYLPVEADFILTVEF
jgi:hypothetical protein